MKLLLAALLSLSSVSVFADDHDKNWEKLPLDQQKQMKLKMLDEKSAMIEDSRTCINEAKDKGALKSCKQEMKDQKKAMKNEWKNKKKQAQEDIEAAKDDTKFEEIEDNE
jgi:hypothetical protein